MKVAMIGWEFPPFMAGGLGIHSLELTTQLAKMGVEIDFYMPHMAIEGPLRVSEHHAHLNIIEVEADPTLSPYGGTERRGYHEAFNDAVHEYNQRLEREWQSDDADLIHAHDWITVDGALRLREATRKPLAWTCHSTEYDRSAGFFPQQWIIEKERAVTQAADAVIAVSEYTRQQLIDVYEADPDRVKPVHNGVDFGKFAGTAMRDYGGDANTVLYLSRVSRQKGPMFFMRAAKRVLDARPQTRIVVAGKGEMVPEMVEYAVKNGISDRVTFTGFIPDEEALRVYQHSDVYVLPSVSEPFGISVLEAMATGLPAIVSKSTGVGEALNHVLKSEFWDTEEMADMILRLLDSKPLRETLGRNGALETRRFTWSNCGRRTLDVYRYALENPREDIAK